MEVSVHLRGGDNVTDMRSMALAEGLSWLKNITVVLRNRGEPATGSDLVVQTGFARSNALLSAIEQEIPYILMEEPIFRGFSPSMTYSSFGYNGLAGGSYRPDPLGYERGRPDLLPMKSEGSTIIFAQKPMDHSLRGSDHIAWLQEKLIEYPEAAVRHHPLMVATQEELASALSRCGRAISYNSTSGVDSLIAGVPSRPEHRGSEAYQVGDREEWLHRLSWAQFSHAELATADVADYILGGYSRAEADAEAGKQEIPREKVDGAAICRRYYSFFPEAQ